MIQKLKITNFQGGIGTLGTTKDKPGTARFTQNLDPFEDTSFVTLSRKTTKVSASTVVDLPLWMKDGSPWTTDRFSIGNAGKLYKIDSSDVVSVLRTVSGSVGEGLFVFDDYLYYALGTDIGRYGRLSGTPAFDDSLLSWWDAAIADDLQQTGGGTGSTDYSTTTAINEGATHIQTLSSVTHDPLKSIKINVDVVGSGDWTVTLHDSEDNEIGAKTLANGIMAATDVTFTFATPLRLVIGQTYHFHVTTTVADGGVDTDANNDLEGAEFTLQYGVLIDSDYHAGVVLEDLAIIANERYLASFNQGEYKPNAIAFDAGFNVRTLIKTEEYVIAECYKGSSPRDAEEFKRYYWDGIKPSFNFSEPINVGAPNATVSHRPDRVIGVYGYKGTLYDSKSESNLTHEAPKLAKGKFVEVLPGAIDKIENRTLIGFGGDTDDTSGLEMGVYEHGGQSTETPVGLNMPFVISTGNTQATNQKIGLVKVIGKDIYFGWRDDTSYGLDKVALGDNAATSGFYESLIHDDGDPDHEKLAVKITASFVALASGESFQVGHQIDRSGSFTLSTAESTVGAISTEISIYSRYKEIELKFVAASSGGTFPKLTQLLFEFDPLSEEREV